MTRLRSQSAMEYLMTYSWAILIIAVVLGALFGLGFFNSASLAPKVSAGSCQVYRPYGPDTTSFINTEGTCNNELPQYVAQFNGASSYISLNTTQGLPLGSSARSIFLWIYWDGYGHYPEVLSYGNYITNTNQDIVLEIVESGHPSPPTPVSSAPFSVDDPQTLQLTSTTSVIVTGQWDFVGFTYDGSNVILYVNGQSVGQQTTTMNTVSTNIDNADIGRKNSQANGYYFQGLISNVQIYNYSFTANEVVALYDEGIGGVPINLNSLVGWWPLNGNANDYSGNQDNGVSTSVIYTSSWTAGYTSP